MKVTIEIPEKDGELRAFTDEALAFFWHVCQHNPSPISNEEAGLQAERVGREIIRRWIKNIEPELYRHQGRQYYWSILQENGKWLPVGNDPDVRKWVPNSKLVNDQAKGGSKA